MSSEMPVPRPSTGDRARADGDRPAGDRGVYPISVVTELTGIEAHLLRAWEKAGLLSPRRSGGGTRRYSGDDVALLRLIRRLANDGLNIPGIRAVLRLEQRVADLEAEVRQLRNRAGRTPDIRVPLYQRLRLPGLGDA